MQSPFFFTRVPIRSIHRLTCTKAEGMLKSGTAHNTGICHCCDSQGREALTLQDVFAWSRAAVPLKLENTCKLLGGAAAAAAEAAAAAATAPPPPPTALQTARRKQQKQQDLTTSKEQDHTQGQKFEKDSRSGPQHIAWLVAHVAESCYQEDDIEDPDAHH